MAVTADSPEVFPQPPLPLAAKQLNCGKLTGQNHPRNTRVVRATGVPEHSDTDTVEFEGKLHGGRMRNKGGGLCVLTDVHGHGTCC